MTEDDLEKPIKGPKPRKAGPAVRRVDPWTAAAVVVGVLLAGVGAWALFVDDPLGGEPIATAAIERHMQAQPSRAASASAAAPVNAASTDHDDGVAAHQGVPVVRAGDPMPKKGPVIIEVPGAATSAASTSTPAAVETAMLEDTSYGSLPRVAPDGRRPLELYARPAPASPGAAARIALVVTGLGVGREASTAALQTLPPAVTLAFSPYGQDVADLVDKARETGHEVLIQSPMEPFGYPDNDTGPQTLLTTLPASANLDRLRWALGRAKGYVGVAPLGGDRFLGADDALAPMFAELAHRGLMFAAATSGEARYAAVADRQGLPHAKPAAILDASQDAGQIDGALKDLETSAKAGGVAVGWASLTPLVLKRIEAWRAGLADRGVALVPVSAALEGKGPS